MKVGDEVYAIESSYAIVRHGFITEEIAKTNLDSGEITRVYTVSYNDCPPYVSYPTWGEHQENELFTEKGQALAYATYLRSYL